MLVLLLLVVRNFLDIFPQWIIPQLNLAIANEEAIAPLRHFCFLLIISLDPGNGEGIDIR
jgi:hypothetical protein